MHSPEGVGGVGGYTLVGNTQPITVRPFVLQRRVFDVSGPFKSFKESLQLEWKPIQSHPLFPGRIEDMRVEGRREVGGGGALSAATLAKHAFTSTHRPIIDVGTRRAWENRGEDKV